MDNVGREAEDAGIVMMGEDMQSYQAQDNLSQAV